MSKNQCGDPCGSIVSKKLAFTEDDLQKMLKAKIRFCEETLGLNHQTAKRWAEETISIVREIDHELD